MCEHRVVAAAGEIGETRHDLGRRPELDPITQADQRMKRMPCPARDQMWQVARDSRARAVGYHLPVEKMKQCGVRLNSSELLAPIGHAHLDVGRWQRREPAPIPGSEPLDIVRPKAEPVHRQIGHRPMIGVVAGRIVRRVSAAMRPEQLCQRLGKENAVPQQTIAGASVCWEEGLASLGLDGYGRESKAYRRASTGLAPAAERSPEGIATKATPEGPAGAALDNYGWGVSGGASALPPGASRIAASAGAEPRRDCNKGHAGGAQRRLH